MFKIRHMFLMSSAINTKFGDFTPTARLRQTIDTIKSIKERVPNAIIVIVESSGYTLEDSAMNQLKENCNVIIDCSGDTEVQKTYNGDSNVNGSFNWDIVKNTCEASSFYKSLGILKESESGQAILSNVDRIHKISGRYLLTDNFNPYLYEVEKDKIIILKKFRTQFSGERFNGIIDIPCQYMTRLWSWPIEKYDTVYKFYEDAINELKYRNENGKFADIEHLLYKFINPDDILEVSKIGIKGIISTGNGVEVNE